MKLSHLDRLSGISGISGDESAVAEAIIRKIDGYARWERDPVGTLFVYKEGKERRKEPMLVMTHMDEPGLLISHITDEGYLRFVTVGEIDSRVLPGRQVAVGENAVPGVISWQGDSSDDQRRTGKTDCSGQAADRYRSSQPGRSGKTD